MDRFKFENREKLIISVLFILISFLASSVLLKDNKFYLLGAQDWDQRYVYAESSRRSILDYKQLPLWNAYHCGGMTQIGNPQNDFFSPAFLLILLYGPVAGYKLLFFFYLFIGLTGFYYLGLHHRISNLGSILLACIYMLSGLVILPFAVGMTAFLNISLLPWLYLFYLNALNKKSLRQVLLTAFTLAAFFMGGFHYFFLVLLFLFIITAAKGISVKSLKPFLIFITVLIIFFPLVAVKLFPSLETLRNSSHFSLKNKETTSGYSLKTLYMSLLSTDQTFNGFYNWGQQDRPSLIDGSSYMIDENGMYVGVAGLVLFLIGIFYKRKKLGLIIIFTFFLILSFGFNLSPSLYKAVHSLPVFENMRVAQRYRYFFMIPFVLFIGYGFDYISQAVFKILKNRFLQMALLILTIFFMVFHLASVNLSFLQSSFEIPLEKLEKSKSFVQSCGAWGDEYKYVSANYGSRDCFEPILLNASAKCSSDKDYTGEYYLDENEGEVNLLYWSQNKLVFTVSIKNKNTLVINQNFAPGWKALLDGKIYTKVKNKNGLLAIELSENNKKIELFYLPNSFLTGALISSVTIFIIVLIIAKTHLFSNRKSFK